MRESRRKHVLPLLGVLKSLKPADRVIVLSHLDDITRDRLYETINHVLSTASPLPAAKKTLLKKRLWKHRDDLRFVTDARKRAGERRKRLLQMGGAPMGYLLKTAVPLLLNLYSK